MRTKDRVAMQAELLVALEEEPATAADIAKRILRPKETVKSWLEDLWVHHHVIRVLIKTAKYRTGIHLYYTALTPLEAIDRATSRLQR